MILAFIFSFSAFFQVADTTSKDHSHLAGIQSVQSIDTLAVFINQYTDSSKYFYNFFDVSDINSQLAPGILYRGQGVGTPSAVIVNGLLPKNQSYVINGFEWSDPVSGSLNPSIFLTSTFSSLKSNNSVSTIKPQNWEIGTDFRTSRQPYTVIHYLDGYDKLSLFEGMFTAQINQTWSARAGLGRKTYEPQFDNGKSDQWQFYVQAKKAFTDSLSSVQFLFMSSKLLAGNYGGIDDSLIKNGGFSRTELNQIPVMFTTSVLKNQSSLFQIILHTKRELKFSDFENSLSFTQTKILNSIDLPISTYNKKHENNSYHHEEIEIANQSDFSIDLTKFSVRFGINKSQFTSEDIFSTSESSVNGFTGFSFSSDFRNNYIFSSFGKIVFHEKKTADFKIQTSILRNINSVISLSLGAQYFQNAIPYLDAFRLGRNFSDNVDEKGILLNSKISYHTQFSETIFSYSFTKLNSSAVNFVNGRVLSDSLIQYVPSDLEKTNTLSLQCILRTPLNKLLGDLDIEGKYLFSFGNAAFPHHDIKLSFAHHDFWFDRALNLWLGIEGNYRSSANTIFFPDSRVGGFLFDQSHSSKAVKRVDLFAHGQVSDMMLKFIFENLTNESVEYFDGYPMPISKFYFSVSWWLWN